MHPIPNPSQILHILPSSFDSLLKQMSNKMDLEQRRKRKQHQKYLVGRNQLLNLPSSKSLFLSFFLFILLIFLSLNRFSLIYFFNNHFFTFHPSLSPSTLSFLHSSKSNSILDPQTTTLHPFTLQHRILFPDYLLLFLTGHRPKPNELECVYYNNGSATGSTEPTRDVNEVQPVLSTDQYDEFRSIARCPFPKNMSTATTVDIRRRGEMGRRDLNQIAKKTQSWDKVAYEATLDGDTVVVFVKGLNLRPHKISDPITFWCHFGLKGFNKEGAFMLTTKTVSVAQEVVRCLLPPSIKKNPGLARGIRVTVSHMVGNARHPVRMLVPSVAKISNPSESVKRKNGGKYELCVCTMVWNQASALREWIMYHAWLGVERWFIYDNNSEDDIEGVINDLDVQGYNVSRQAWPWIKTQEAGFSHCALRAREECKWVGFFDVDEFFYFPNEFRHRIGQGGGVPGENSLRLMVANLSSSSSIAEIRTACHSFGPSGLMLPPKQGVTIGYTCRLQSLERHKSIVRPDLLDISLLNVVHHFQLREGLKSIDMSEGNVVINHYKYQVWENFKAKFFRRVATYVVDWQKDQNKGSKDRAPGLGTEAIEPPNWRLQFCEVRDTGLKDFLVSYFADSATGLMPWERS
ncbi:putative Glycosyltransferase family 92 [Lupinus albus]|uniref:Glycosyltransferase family 92 protein n=1 Tax=Lupinus albus TaxID=3870 RepID=A0A6A4PZX9_LUPAL|nr:putative Glycosyltransferase family 92 [Lupinus albus]